MGITQHLPWTRPTSRDSNAKPAASTSFASLLTSNLLLSALSITNVALINSVAAWTREQKHNVHSFQIEWSGSATPLPVEPADLWVGHGYESNAVACYGFVLGVFGIITAWRSRKAGRTLPSVKILAALQFSAILFTLSALVFVFVVTYRTTGQHIREPVASNNIGSHYPEFTWTPETWLKAVLDLPLIDGDKRKEIDSQVAKMVAWRWMLVPVFVVDCVAFSVTLMAWQKQRRNVATRVGSANSVEK